MQKGRYKKRGIAAGWGEDWGLLHRVGIKVSSSVILAGQRDIRVCSTNAHKTEVHEFSSEKKFLIRGFALKLVSEKQRHSSAWPYVEVSVADMPISGSVAVPV